MSRWSRGVGWALVTGIVVVTMGPSVGAQPGEIERNRRSRLDAPLPPAVHYEGYQTRTDLLGGGDRPAILLTGYWPPTNEMVRRFSNDPAQNPDGWIGSNWEGRGYDIYAYFPEFEERDCDFCGRGSGNLEVDYQDTSQDFWTIANSVQPIAIITFSRGFWDMSWEVEVNQYNRDRCLPYTWMADYDYSSSCEESECHLNDGCCPGGPCYLPTPNPPDPGHNPDGVRLSALPVEEIVDAVNDADLGVDAYVNYGGDGGGFLSEFIAYHGVWYQALHASEADPAWCVAAGHIHVGRHIDWPTAEQATFVSLRTLIVHVDGIVGGGVCQVDLGYGGPGSSTLSVCGDPLHSGGQAELLLENAAPYTTAFFFMGPFYNPTPFFGGTLVPMPPIVIQAMPTDGSGAIRVPVAGGGGPILVYLQALYLDVALPYGIGFSNALELDIQT